MARIAVAKVRSGATPTVTGPRSSEVWSRPDGGMRRLSAEKASRRPFWIATDRPKVTRSGGRMSRPSVRLSTKSCSAQPRANMTGRGEERRTERG
jgi:hypothetical protein